MGVKIQQKPTLLGVTAPEQPNCKFSWLAQRGGSAAEGRAG